jgi:hypothetical protein
MTNGASLGSSGRACGSLNRFINHQSAIEPGTSVLTGRSPRDLKAQCLCGGTISKERNQMSSGKIAVAAAAFASVAFMTFGWSAEASAQEKEHARAQANEKTEMPSKHVAPRRERHAMRRGHGERHVARGYYGERRMARPYYGPNPVAAGADIAAGAVNTAGAVAAGAIGTAGAIAAAPFGAGPYAAGPGYDGPYYASSAWGDYECRPGAGPYECRPYASKDWYRR